MHLHEACIQMLPTLTMAIRPAWQLDVSYVDRAVVTPSKMSDTRQETDNSALVSAVLLSLMAIPVLARPQHHAFVPEQGRCTAGLDSAVHLRRRAITSPATPSTRRTSYWKLKTALLCAAPGPVPADLPEQRVHRRSKVRGSRSVIQERPS